MPAGVHEAFEWHIWKLNIFSGTQGKTANGTQRIGSCTDETKWTVCLLLSVLHISFELNCMKGHVDQGIRGHDETINKCKSVVKQEIFLVLIPAYFKID